MKNTSITLAFLIACLLPGQHSKGQSVQVPQIVLDKYWETPMQGGSAAIEDLGTLFSPFARPNADTSSAPAIMIYNGVTYLMPLREARQKLGLTELTVPRVAVVCGGFPRDSFFHYAFKGVFEGQYNMLYLVTDKAEQVVCVQLVADTPRKDLVDYSYSQGSDWHVYNFINGRSKAMSKLVIDHKQLFQEKNRWIEYRPKYNSGLPKSQVELLRIDSTVINPGRSFSDWRPLEAVRWYVPAPMMELILHCVQKAQR